MALKTVLLLALVGLVYSLSCSGDRDCTCADKAFGECDEPSAGDAVHVNTWQECKAQCDLFFSFGACDWWLFNAVNGMDENCHLFNPEREPMTDYLGSCNIVMGPLFDNADNQLTDCSKDGCEGYVESECAKKGIEVDTAETPLPNAEACQLVMISRAGANALTYYTYDVRAKVTGMELGPATTKLLCRPWTKHSLTHVKPKPKYSTINSIWFKYI